MATHSSILACRIPWTEGLVDYSPWSRKEWNTTSNWARIIFTLHYEAFLCIFYLSVIVSGLILPLQEAIANLREKKKKTIYIQMWSLRNKAYSIARRNFSLQLGEISAFNLSREEFLKRSCIPFFPVEIKRANFDFLLYNQYLGHHGDWTEVDERY